MGGYEFVCGGGWGWRGGRVGGEEGGGGWEVVRLPTSSLSFGKGGTVWAGVGILSFWGLALEDFPKAAFCANPSE